MAHPISVKAAAWAQLLTGDSVAHVARTTGLPKQTISRWKQQAFRFARRSLESTPRGRHFLAEIRGVAVGGRDKMGRKKTRAREVAAQSGASAKV